jgi:hypothetical protein
VVRGLFTSSCFRIDQFTVQRADRVDGTTDGDHGLRRFRASGGFVAVVGYFLLAMYPILIIDTHNALFLASIYLLAIPNMVLISVAGMSR